MAAPVDHHPVDAEEDDDEWEGSTSSEGSGEDSARGDSSGTASSSDADMLDAMKDSDDTDSEVVYLEVSVGKTPVCFARK